MQQARRIGAISREEHLEGFRSDIIAREVDDTDHRGPLAVVEISVSFNRNDLENAARRAAVISKISGTDTAAFVAMHSVWPNEVNAVAEGLGVTILRHEDPDHQDSG